MESEKKVTNAAAANLSSIRIRLVLAAITFCLFVLGFSMFKLLPMQAAIQEYFDIDISTYGYLNTAQNWFVILFTVPFGFVIRKLPCKWSMLISFVLLLGGSLIQIFTTNYILFVIGRMLEGGGYGFMALIGHSLTANLVKPQRIGFWISFMVTVGMLGQVIHTNVGTWMMLSKGLSFQQVFIAIFILQVICLVFWLLIVPSTVKVTGIANAQKPTKEQTMRVYKNPSNWLVSIALIFFNMAVVSFSAFVIQYLIIRGLEPGNAAATYGYTSLFGIAAMLVFGLLSDKFKTKRKLAILSFFSGILALLLLVHLPISAILIYVVVFGTLPRSVAGMSSACAPDIAEMPADVPIVNSFRNTVSQLGGVIGGIFTGYILQYFGYEITIYMLCVAMGLGGICWIFAKKIP
jgi:MFS transporter, DHA1 family, inner membrane transport protein